MLSCVLYGQPKGGLRVALAPTKRSPWHAYEAWTAREGGRFFFSRPRKKAHARIMLRSASHALVGVDPSHSAEQRALIFMLVVALRHPKK